MGALITENTRRCAAREARASQMASMSADVDASNSTDAHADVSNSSLIDQVSSSTEALKDDSLSDIEKSCAIERFQTASGASVIVVGTAHVSSKSCDDVQAVIRRVKPQVWTLQT